MIPRLPPFWRNAILIAAGHAAVVVGIVRFTGGFKKPEMTKDVVWLQTEALTAVALEAAPPARPTPAETAVPELTAVPRPEEDAIELPTPTPPPTATPEASTTPPPLPTVTPKPTRTPTPRPTQTPRASPKKKATPRKTTPASTPTRASTPAKKPSPTSSPTASATSAAPPDAKGTENGSPAESPAGQAVGRGGSAGSKSALALYRGILHNRFYGAWSQPTTSVPAGSTFAATVRLRIEKDGRVSSFRVVRSSGNVIVDESIAAIANRVTQVDPPPEALVAIPYEVSIRFELNPD